MTAAISSVEATRPTGMSAASLASFSGVVPTRMLVSTAPGVTALTVTPVLATSRARALVNPRMAALADEYGTLPKTPPPRCADTDDMLTMRPQPASIMAGGKAFVTKNVPGALTAMTVFQMSSVVSRNGTGEVMPAMLASAPTGGRLPDAISAATAACASATECSDVTSTAWPNAGTANWLPMSAATLADFSPSRSRMTTAQPSRA